MINNFFVILLKWFISFTWFPPKNDYFISLWFSQMIHLFPHLISSHDSLIFTRCFSHLFYLWSSHTIHTVLFFTWWIFTSFFSHDSFIYFTVIVFKRDPPPHTHTPNDSFVLTCDSFPMIYEIFSHEYLFFCVEIYSLSHVV